MAGSPLETARLVDVREGEPPARGISLLFPGQGIQFERMAEWLIRDFESARKTFKTADEVMGLPITAAAAGDQSHLLAKTEYAQAAIGATCVAIYRAIQEVAQKEGVSFNPSISAGISFGELPNLVARGVLTLETMFEVINKRGEIMEEEGGKLNGRMISALYRDPSLVIDGFCEGSVQVAIRYPTFSALSGTNEDLKKVIPKLEKAKVKVIEPGVFYPFHNSLMEEARIRFEDSLKNIPFADPDGTIVMNASAQAVSTGIEIKTQLPQQLVQTVDGTAVIRALRDRSHFVIEPGPKPFLSRLVNRADGGLTGFTVDSMEALQKLVEILKARQEVEQT